jgi:hypothetical protein
MPAQAPQPSREKLSKVPSWIMLGVVLGGIGFYGVQSFFDEQRGKKQRQKAPPAASTPALPPARDASGGKPSATAKNDPHMSLFAIDAVFRAHGASAVWEHDLTEIVLWNPATQSYSTGVEVLRNGDTYYYRLLDRLTRPVLTEGVDPNAPIRLTEPASYQERRRQQRQDTWRSRPPAPSLLLPATPPTIIPTTTIAIPAPASAPNPNDVVEKSFSGSGEPPPVPPPANAQ